MDKYLHIVCLDIPYPVDYGGVVDLFFKIKALHLQGIKIHLHCFTKNRAPQDELNKYCESVHYYQRKPNSKSFSFRLPLIVKSRANSMLISNLSKDNHPVLLEGIHCTYFLFNGQLKNRKVIVRLHNVEYEYYRQLARYEKNFFKKLYYFYESCLLKKYEKAIADKATILTVSKQDAEKYQLQFKAKNVHYLQVFIPPTEILSKPGKGSFCLYHGNLGINENEKAATWLLQKVFNKINIPLVITGKNPSKRLEHLAHQQLHTCLVANPTHQELQDMIQKAHIHILPSFNNTGVKLKLFNALFNGRHCLVNKAGVTGSGLEAYCHIAEDAAHFQQKITELFELPFTNHEIQERQHLLKTTCDMNRNVEELIKFLW